MEGLIEALNREKFRCIGPAQFAGPIEFLPDEDSKPAYSVFESPSPRRQQVPVEFARTVPLVFRHFLDGSESTTPIGHIVDSKDRYLPLFVSQIGVAVTRLEGTNLKISHHEEKQLLLLPATFSPEDLFVAEHVVDKLCESLPSSLALQVKTYRADGNDKPVENARKKVLSLMHDLEVSTIEKFTQSGAVSDEEYFMVDGSLQFYTGKKDKREAFQNVVGVAKSFNLQKSIGKGSKATQAGTLIAGLKPKHRTPAFRIEDDRGDTIGTWYLRLHGGRSSNRNRMDDGVVKLEVYAHDGIDPDAQIDSNRCDLISQGVLALRHPTTPATDGRWASHLYPIYLTERYIRSRFQKPRTIMAYL